MSEGPNSGSRAVGLITGSLIVNRHADRGVAAEDIHDFDASRVSTFFWIRIVLLGNGSKRAILARPVVLPMMVERAAVAVVKIHRPKVDEIEAALDRSLLEFLKFSG